MFLTAEELIALTGRQTRPAQARALTFMGIDHKRRPDGSLAVLKAHVERFTEHDLRAKVGSDAESLARAQELLAHADAKMTEKFYRRKPQKIAPAG